jgi:mannose-6-phosphate isomerase-like protein (cupin superfamily)
MNKELKIWVLGHILSPQKLSANYDLAIGESCQNVPGPPPHHHDIYHETFYIMDGEMEFIIDGVHKRIRQGESIDIPPNTVHTFRNTGEKACKWVNIHSPKGFFEFFKQYGVPENEPDAAKKSVSPEIIQEVLKTAQDYDMKIQTEENSK